MRILKIIILVLVFVSAAGAEVSEKVTYKIYTARQKSGVSLLDTLSRYSPIRHKGMIFHGYTAWHIDWKYRWDEDASGRCRITGNKTHLNAVITLPKLISSDAKTKSEFSRYLQSLHTHELGHLQIAREAAGKIDRDILSLPAMTSCRLLEQTANQVGHKILEQARQKERTYDQETNHGASQGALLPGAAR